MKSKFTLSAPFSIRRAAKSLILDRSVLLAGIYWKSRFKLDSLSTQDTIIIYTSGHVGSTAVYHSVRALDLGAQILNTHRLSRCELLGANGHYRYFACKYINSLLEDASRERPVKLITVVRDPVARNVGGFFQWMSGTRPELIQRVARGEVRMEELEEIFLEEYDQYYILRWFDLEIKAVLGIDVFAHPFDKVKGYNIISNDNLDLLILRLEDLDRCWAPAVKDVFGVDGASVAKANRATQKVYGRAYDEFKARVRLPRVLLDRLYGDRYSSHFYAPEEIAAARDRWERNAS